MLLEPRLIVELALLGCTTGMLSGLLGIGGGMMMVPFLSILLDAKGYPAQYAVKIAVATSLATDFVLKGIYGAAAPGPDRRASSSRRP